MFDDVKCVVNYTGWLSLNYPDLIRVKAGDELMIEFFQFKEYEKRGFVTEWKAPKKVKPEVSHEILL